MTALADKKVGSEMILHKAKRAMAASVKAWKGGLAMIDAGYVKPAVSGSGAAIFFDGVFTETVDNTGIAGAKSVEVEFFPAKRVKLYANDGVNTCVVADRGKLCYLEDDQTVGNLSTSKTSPGRIYDVVSAGVWVELGAK